jgi:flagellar biosynthesis anti-sigma factor FlgM
MSMDIRNSPDRLKSLSGITPTTPPATQPKPSSEASPSELSNASATVSNAGSGVASTAADSDVRLDKVSNIQKALAAGTYKVSATAVASKIVDAMLDNKR